jgi:hypothetical protein
LFGFQAWSPARREMVGRLLSDAGVVVQPAVEQAGRDDRLVFSMPALGVRTGTPPEPQPTAEWFAYLAGLRLTIFNIGGYWVWSPGTWWVMPEW